MSLLGFAINSHQAEMVGIDQPQTSKWLKMLSDAETVDWANNLSSVCEWASEKDTGPCVEV